METSRPQTERTTAASFFATGSKLHHNYRVLKLGARPSSNPTWFPLLGTTTPSLLSRISRTFMLTVVPAGLDFIYFSLKNANRNRSYEGWREKSQKLGHTFELTILLRRFLFTAEPENIKAILATQFADFGGLRPGGSGYP